MKVFDSIRELRNGKKYDTASNAAMSENSNCEGRPALNYTEANETQGPKSRALNQAEVDEQINSFIATSRGSKKIWLVFSK